MINNWRYLLFILFFIIHSKALSQNLVVDITEGNVDPLPIALQKFVSDIIDQTDFVWNETTYTAIISIYSNKLLNNFDKAVYYFAEMMKKSIHLKIRTLNPLFNICYNNKNLEYSKELYLIAKINDIVLYRENYIQLIELFKNDIFVVQIVKDFTSKYSKIF